MTLALPMNHRASSPRPSPPFRMEERVAAGRERRLTVFQVLSTQNCIREKYHPGPLPQGEGKSFTIPWSFQRQRSHGALPKKLERAMDAPSPGGEGKGEGGRSTNFAAT